MQCWRYAERQIMSMPAVGPCSTNVSAWVAVVAGTTTLTQAQIAAALAFVPAANQSGDSGLRKRWCWKFEERHATFTYQRCLMQQTPASDHSNDSRCKTSGPTHRL